MSDYRAFKKLAVWGLFAAVFYPASFLSAWASSGTQPSHAHCTINGSVVPFLKVIIPNLTITETLNPLTVCSTPVTFQIQGNIVSNIPNINVEVTTSSLVPALRTLPRNGKSIAPIFSGSIGGRTIDTTTQQPLEIGLTNGRAAILLNGVVGCNSAFDVSNTHINPVPIPFDSLPMGEYTGTITITAYQP